MGRTVNNIIQIYIKDNNNNNMIQMANSSINRFLCVFFTLGKTEKLNKLLGQRADPLVEGVAGSVTYSN